MQRIIDVRQLKAQQFPEDAGPLAHPVRPESYIEINNFYTVDGLREGRRGRAHDRRPCSAATASARAWTSTSSATTARRRRSRSSSPASRTPRGADLTQFKLWYSQAGTPELVCQSHATTRPRRPPSSTVEQVLPPTPGQPKKKPLHIPMRLGLLGANGADLALKLATATASPDGVARRSPSAAETFRFIDVPSRPVPSLLRGFSAPVNLTIDLVRRRPRVPDGQRQRPLQSLAGGQNYALRVLAAAVKEIKAGGRPAKPVKLIEALRGCLANDAVEPALKAQMLTLPGEAEVARTIARDIDPTAIHAACRSLRRQVASALAPALVETYKSMDAKGAYSPDAVSAGRRALRNAALALLNARGLPEDIARTYKHFSSARNATDEIDALALLTSVRGKERTLALQQFHDKWAHDHLVIDHWFGLQAASTLPSCLATVRRLTRHPLFQQKNPNKLRTLIGGFAANPVSFNRPDGLGYEFVAEKVLEIDAFNPQVASRILTSFRSWRSLETNRRKLAKRALKRIAKVKGLSRDVHEIVSRMLES